MASRQGADLLGQGQKRLFVLAAEIGVRFSLEPFHLLARRIEGGVPIELIDQRVAQRVAATEAVEARILPR